MKIIISKDIKNFMRYAKRISEIEGRETGFLLHRFNLPGQNYNIPCDIFHTDMLIGDKKCIYMRSKYKNFPRGLEDKIIVCGSFHVHSHKRYLDNCADSKIVDEHRLAYIKECCRNCISFDDLETVLHCITKKDPKCMITCVLSDIEDHVSYYIPKKHVSIEEFTLVYNRFKKDQQRSICTETIHTYEGIITFPTLEYRRAYGYVLDLFNEDKFDLHSEETIIDI